MTWLVLFVLSAFVLSFDPVLAKRIDARIIGGSDAAAGQFPFAAAMYVQTSNSRFFCGGALVANQWIVTSAHCVDNGVTITVQLGSNSLTLSDSERVIVSTSDYIIHPDWDPERIENDVALIKLRLPISYNTYIQPINLPPVSLLNETAVTAIGWGQTSDYSTELSEHLQFVQATILSNAECQLIYGNQITENMACVEGNYNEGTCNGDNGGPLVEHLGRYYWIVGIASFVSGNGCESTDPSGYTRIFPYVDWIRENISS